MEEMDSLKRLLNISDDSYDFYIEFALEKVREMVKNYCRIDTVPKGLKNTVISMAFDLLRAESYGEKELFGYVKSLSEGDLSLSFDYSAFTSEDRGLALLKSSTAQRFSFLRNYVLQLDRYRKPGF